MTRHFIIGSQLGGFLREIGAMRYGPLPRSAMLRNGAAIGAGFLTFIAFGYPEAAVICAVFTNFLCLTDRAPSLRARLWVQAVGATLSIAFGAVGTLITGNDPLILVSTFALALFAGFIHGTLPGVEAIPRYSLSCFVAAAFLPVGNLGVLAAVLVGTAFSIVAIRVDDHIRHGRRGIRIARANSEVRYPGPRFSIVYAIAAVCGLGIGLLWNQTRPYWVTITTLLVMQPDRHANTVRVVQRFIGTLVGVVVAFAVTHVVPAPIRPGVLVLLGVLLPFFWPLGFDRNYGLGIAIIGAWVLILINFALPATEEVIPVFLARLSDTAIGCAVALAGSLVVYEAEG